MTRSIFAFFSGSGIIISYNMCVDICFLLFVNTYLDSCILSYLHHLYIHKGVFNVILNTLLNCF
uniref:Uncharacterized protein n=1 Tax=Schistosoma japonicum TaxID=6182 RepID=Q5C2M7_SCHJA|nr:unknown [Schistosoma japonicum]